MPENMIELCCIEVILLVNQEVKRILLIKRAIDWSAYRVV